MSVIRHWFLWHQMFEYPKSRVSQWTINPEVLFCCCCFFFRSKSPSLPHLSFLLPGWTTAMWNEVYYTKAQQISGSRNLNHDLAIMSPITLIIKRFAFTDILMFHRFKLSFALLTFLSLSLSPLSIPSCPSPYLSPLSLSSFPLSHSLCVVSI